MKIGVNIFKTVAQENIYKESADFFVGDQYFPLKKLSERIYDKVLKDYDYTNQYVNVQRMIFGIDKYLFDDTHPQLFESTLKSIQYLNMKQLIDSTYGKFLYSFEGS